MIKIKSLCFVVFILCLLVNVAIAKGKEEVVDCSINDDNLMYCENKKGKPITGKIEAVNQETGERNIESYTKGYRHGLSTFFNEKGVLKERSYYKRGILNGMSKIYYDNRTIKYLLNYKDGELDGKVDIYSRDGQLQGRLKYQDGVLKDGFCVDQNGKKRQLTIKQINAHQKGGLYDCGVK